MPLRALPVWAAGPTSPDRPSRWTWASRRERRHRSRHSRRESSASMPGVDPAVSCVPSSLLCARYSIASAPFPRRSDRAMMAGENPVSGGENMVRPASRPRGRFRALSGLAAGVLCAAFAALPLPTSAQSAESFPSRPVKIVVPYAPGGATDIIARIVAARLTESLGQSVLVENRPGASGNLALEAVAKAPADGYTLLVGNVSTNTINENTFAHQLQIKPSRDLVGIAKLVEIPHIIATTAGFPANSLAELIALAKKDPGRINYASEGLGSYPHLDMEKLMKAAGIQMTHIPYK